MPKLPTCRTSLPPNHSERSASMTGSRNPAGSGAVNNTNFACGPRCAPRPANKLQRPRAGQGLPNCAPGQSVWVMPPSVPPSPEPPSPGLPPELPSTRGPSPSAALASLTMPASSTGGSSPGSGASPSSTHPSVELPAVHALGSIADETHLPPGRAHVVSASQALGQLPSASHTTRHGSMRRTFTRSSVCGRYERRRRATTHPSYLRPGVHCSARTSTPTATFRLTGPSLACAGTSVMSP